MTNHRTAGVSPALTAKKSERDARGPTAGLHKHWHSRGYLPHCDVPGLIQAVTFRLADSLPSEVLEGLKYAAGDNKEQHKRVDTLLDAGYGACWLKQPEIAARVEDALLHWDGTRYHLLAWCVMPNHVHALIETHTDFPLPDVVHSWKSFLAHAINQHLGRTRAVWMHDYFDRYVRDDHHLAAVIAYIHANPVKAGLVSDEPDWPYSSARLIRTAGVSPALSTSTKKSGRDARGPHGPTAP